MKPVLKLADGYEWKQLVTTADGDEAQRLSETAVGHFFARHLKSGEDHLSRADFYVLMAADGAVVPVAMMLVRPGQETHFTGKTLITGRRNGNPFANNAEAIAALSAHLGQPITEADYPYGKHVALEADEEEPAEAPRP